MPKFSVICAVLLSCCFIQSLIAAAATDDMKGSDDSEVDGSQEIALQEDLQDYQDDEGDNEFSMIDLQGYDDDEDDSGLDDCDTDEQQADTDSNDELDEKAIAQGYRRRRPNGRRRPSYSRRGPSQYGRRRPSYGRRGPSQYGRRGPSQYGRRGPSQYGRRGPSYGRKGPSNGRRGPSYGRRGPSQYGRRGPSYGRRGPSYNRGRPSYAGRRYGQQYKQERPSYNGNYRRPSYGSDSYGRQQPTTAPDGSQNSGLRKIISFVDQNCPSISGNIIFRLVKKFYLRKITQMQSPMLIPNADYQELSEDDDTSMQQEDSLLDADELLDEVDQQQDMDDSDDTSVDEELMDNANMEGFGSWIRKIKDTGRPSLKKFVSFVEQRCPEIKQHSFYQNYAKYINGGQQSSQQEADQN